MANPDNSNSLKRLVKCPQCQSQYDVGSFPTGHRFHCACGAAITIPDLKPHDSKVVRCSSCAGPRQGTGKSCRYCGAAFTLHERDLHTICPSCLTRIADRSRFCHSCGTAITPQKLPNKKSHFRCPACRSQPRLLQRTLGEATTVLECGKCGGIWLGHELFALLQQRAVDRQIAWLRSPEHDAAGANSPQKQDRLYRLCPVCGCHMNRQNFKRRSGVIVDVCAQDGLWLDLGELDRLLDWVQQGGLAKATQLDDQRRRQAEIRKNFERPGDPMAGGLFPHSLQDRERTVEDWVGGLVQFLFRG